MKINAGGVLKGFTALTILQKSIIFCIFMMLYHIPQTSPINLNFSE